MRRKSLWFGANVGLLLLAVLMAASETARAEETCQLVRKSTGEPFMMYEVIRYRNTPERLGYCLQPMKIWYGREFWPDGTPSRKAMDLGLPKRDLVQTVAKRSLSYGPVSVFDIEHWPLEDEDYADAAVDNYVTITDWFREVTPQGQQFGFYGMVPIRDYFRAIEGKDHGEYKEWQAENDRLTPFADAVDILFPSLYTFYDKPEEWLIYAKAQIDESRRLADGKSVVAFVWPTYHQSNRRRGGDPIEPDFWRLQLDFLEEHADGAIIWTHSAVKKIDFADIPPWWDATVQFLDERFECRDCS
ncbi:MAG: hypothetical protein AAF543_11220 [Pseudomonadota bacterium]